MFDLLSSRGPQEAVAVRSEKSPTQHRKPVRGESFARAMNAADAQDRSPAIDRADNGARSRSRGQADLADERKLSGASRSSFGETPYHKTGRQREFQGEGAQGDSVSEATARGEQPDAPAVSEDTGVRFRCDRKNFPGCPTLADGMAEDDGAEVCMENLLFAVVGADAESDADVPEPAPMPAPNAEPLGEPFLASDDGVARPASGMPEPKPATAANASEPETMERKSSGIKSDAGHAATEEASTPFPEAVSQSDAALVQRESAAAALNGKTGSAAADPDSPAGSQETPGALSHKSVPEAPPPAPPVRERAVAAEAPASANEPGETMRMPQGAGALANADSENNSGEDDRRHAFTEEEGRQAAHARSAAVIARSEGQDASMMETGESWRNTMARQTEEATLPDAPSTNAPERMEHMQTLVERFGDLLAGTLSAKGKAMTVRLVPAALGSLTLRCREEGGRLSVEIAAETREARMFLAEHAEEIRTVAQNNGYRLAHFDVFAQGEEAERRHFHARRQEGNGGNGDRGGRSAKLAESAMAPELLEPLRAEPGRLWLVA